jgi:hypothetical protein
MSLPHPGYTPQKTWVPPGTTTHAFARIAITLQHSPQIARTPTCEIPMARVYSASSLFEPREDFDDFSQFAVRVLASTAHAGRPFRPLKGASVSIDRA